MGWDPRNLGLVKWIGIYMRIIHDNSQLFNDFNVNNNSNVFI